MEDTNFPGKAARVSEMGRTAAIPGLAKLLETQTKGKKTQGCLTSCSLPPAYLTHSLSPQRGTYLLTQLCSRLSGLPERLPQELALWANQKQRLFSFLLY